MDDSHERRVLPFARRNGNGGGNEPPDGGDPIDDNAELVAPGDIYATAGGQRVAVALRFIRTNLRSFSVPYAYLPLLWWQPPGSLLIEYPGLFTVSLRGKELDELHRRIADHRVTWIREFDPAQAAAMATAVTRIDILHAYPSRDG
jgi:hypothetical protein